MSVKCIIFDKDGTLIDFDSFWISVSEYALKEILMFAGADMTLGKEITEALGVRDGSADIEGILCSGTYDMISDVCYNILSKHGCAVDRGLLSEKVLKSFRSSVSKGVIEPVCDNIRDVFEELRNENITIALVTTDESVITMKCLDALGITEFFDIIYTDDGVHPAKPDPYCINEICKNQSLDKSELIMVGDTLTDMYFAENGGIRAVGVAKNENNRKVLEPYANAVIKDISYIFDVIHER